MGKTVNRERLAGYLTTIGVVQFLLLLIVAEAIYPGYSVSHNYISDLGNPRYEPTTPHAAIFNSSVGLLGALLMVAGALFLTLRPRLDKVLGAMVFLAGLGALGVGLFPEGSPYHLHTIFSLITFLFASLSSYPASVRRGGGSPLWGILGTIGLIALVLYAMGYYAGLGWGGMERLIVYPNLAWALGFGASLATAEARPR